ncbi:ATP/GTP-binding protein [Aeromonas salmonicida]|uniref:AAA family ATPase n=1 Tax=Aeromonas salmonicida TaxID=645 RepID=UPI0035A5A69E
MLIQFKVTNFGSIRDEAVLSMVAGSEKEPDGPLKKIYTPEAPATKDLLKAAAIYGANASGKSHCIYALAQMRNIVIKSTRSQEGDELPYNPYAFCKESKRKETEFEIEFISNGIRYQYGFSYNKIRVVDEWLFAYPKGRAQKWIMRYVNDDGETIYERSDFLLGSKKLWETATRDNALFLSTAVQLKSEDLKPVFDWFRDILHVVSVNGVGDSFSIEQISKNNTKHDILKFMKSADFSINDFIVEERDDVPDEILKEYGSDHDDVKFIDFKTVHKTDDGDLAELDYEQESDGTQRMFQLSGPWVDTLENGYVLAIDELSLHLHPSLSSFLVKLFYSKMNKNNAQLIFTTHEVSLLSDELMRRDQVWLMKRSLGSGSMLEPLSDFSARKDENLRKRYLDGRYGAVPIVKLSSLVDALDEKEH